MHRLISRLILVMGACMLVLAVAGYPLFRSQIAAYRSDSAMLQSLEPSGAGAAPPVEGIVVLTGDRERIRTGFDLFESGIAKRMLVSGVHEHTSREAVFRLGGVMETALPCCIDIGHAAENTVGNALETARWAEQHGVKRLVVVTSDYHMPRSLLELSRQMPGVQLLPFAAQADPSASLFARNRAAFVRHTLREYGKYLAAHARLMVGGNLFSGQFPAQAAN